MIAGVIPFRLFAALLLSLPAFGETGLDALRSSLMSMRGKPPDSGGPRGASPQLTVAKHQLRDWVESHLNESPIQTNEGELENKLNAELRTASLFCGEDAAQQPPCPEWTQLGFLCPLKLHRSGPFLTLQTSVGINCGYDESAYLYDWSEEGWHRAWQNEQNTYTERDYKPQRIRAVLISPYHRPNEYFVLTLGVEPWCSSNWHNIYYRAFRLGPELSPAPLIDGTEYGVVQEPIQGSITHQDALVEFAIAGFEGGFTRRAIRHFSIDGEEARRIDPVALNPRDFVAEWRDQKKREALRWAESTHRRSLVELHERLVQTPGEFIPPTMHCPATPDIWQVGIHLLGSDKPHAAGAGTVYLLVRWRPPYHFTLVDAHNRPSPACTERDPDADEDRSLFPAQN